MKDCVFELTNGRISSLLYLAVLKGKWIFA